MKKFTIVAIGAALAMFAGSTGPALAEETGSVKGTGSYREKVEDTNKRRGKSRPKGKANGHRKHKGKPIVTEKVVTLWGVDDTEADYGELTIDRKTTGQSPTRLFGLEIDCVSLSEDTAYLSGLDRNGDRFYVVVEDHADPGSGKDRFGYAGDSDERSFMHTLGMDCGAGSTILEPAITTEPIDSGNFAIKQA